MRRVIFLLSLVCAAYCVSSCKKQKDDEEIVIDKVIDKPSTSTQSMAEKVLTGTVKWISGADYTYTITRRADETLQRITSHELTYYDNSIELVIRRADGSVFFEKTFTRKNFEQLLPSHFKAEGVLLGMNFEEVRGNNLRFVVGIGSPDDSYDEFFHLLMSVNNYGGTSCEVYKAKNTH